MSFQASTINALTFILLIFIERKCRRVYAIVHVWRSVDKSSWGLFLSFYNGTGGLNSGPSERVLPSEPYGITGPMLELWFIIFTYCFSLKQKYIESNEYIYFFKKYAEQERMEEEREEQ